MSERMDGWRECADPVELAAAVAAGVEVQRNWGYDWQPGTNNETAEQFAGCTKANCRYRVPASWSWSPEPPAPDDLVSRARRHAETHPESRDLTGAERYLAERLADPEYRAAYEAAAPAAGDDLRERIARAGFESQNNTTRWADLGDGSKWIWRHYADAVLAVLPPQPAPSPVPPWPGAVLSGLVDEDGVPTWLAQAWQVRGEQARGVRSGPWGRNVYGDTVWVEVRAPWAVPAPETERVNVLDAIRNRIELTHPEGEFLAVGVELREDGDLVAIEQQEPLGKAQPVAPDGTVEVLRRDGDQ